MIFRAVGLVDRFSSFQGQVEMLNREFGGLWLAKSESNSEQLTLVIEVDQTDFRCKYQVQLAVNPCSWEGVRVDAPSKVKGGVASSSAGAIASTVQGQDEMDSMHKTPEGVVFSFKNLSGKTSARGISQAVSFPRSIPWVFLFLQCNAILSLFSFFFLRFAFSFFSFCSCTLSTPSEVLPLLHEEGNLSLLMFLGLSLSPPACSSPQISGVVTDVNAGSRDGQSLLQRLTTALHEWPAMSAPLMRSPGVAE